MHSPYASLGRSGVSENRVMQKCIGYALCSCTVRQFLEFWLVVMQMCISYALCLCTLRWVLKFRIFGYAEVHRLCTLLMQVSATFGFSVFLVMQKCIGYALCLCMFR